MISFRDKQKFGEIDWLMPSIDIEHACEVLGIKTTDRNGDELIGYCPDHYLFTGREPSDPKWGLNMSTGQTYCFTEGRGSNLIFIGARLLQKSPTEVAQILTGKQDLNFGQIEIDAILNKAKRLLAQPTENFVTENSAGSSSLEKNLNDIRADLVKRPVSQRLYDFFMNPPGKKFPTGIKKETVDKYGVFERTWGFFADRAIIPYFMRGKLVGFSALDLLGKEEWMKRHPALQEKDYRKVRYPEGFSIGECLFGFDFCQKNCDNIIILEGAREVMKLVQEGYQNAVAINGAYLTQSQFLLLSSLNPKELILMFDGDDAGYAITDRVAQMLIPLYGERRVTPCYLPRGVDPKNLDGGELGHIIEEARTHRDSKKNLQKPL